MIIEWFSYYFIIEWFIITWNKNRNGAIGLPVENATCVHCSLEHYPLARQWNTHQGGTHNTDNQIE